jgi:hypothetical protein
MPAKPLRLYRISSPFIADENGREVAYVDRTQIYTEQHPAVKRYGGNFVEVTPLGPDPQPVEATTANPGEKRTVAR